MKAIKNLVKPGYIITLALLIILGSLLFSNLDHILGKFGYETKADLRAELVHTKNLVVDLKSRNENLAYVIETEKKICLIREDVIEYVTDQQIDIDKVVTEALKGLVIPVINDIPDKDVSKPSASVEPDKKEVSYEKLVSVYDTLFGATA